MRKFVALAVATAALGAFTGTAAAEEVDFGGYFSLGANDQGYAAYIDGNEGNGYPYTAGYAGIRLKDNDGNDAPDGCYSEDGSPNDTDGDDIADYEDADLDGDGIDDDGFDANGNMIDANGDGQPDADDSVESDSPDGCLSSPSF